MKNQDVEKDLKTRLSSLEDRMPSMSWDTEDLWSKIEENLNKNPLSDKQLWLQIAASLLILLAVKYFIQRFTFDQVELTYSSEIVLEPSQVMTGKDLPTDALAFINENCITQEMICGKSEFRYLKNELDKLRGELDKLDLVISKYGEGPELVKARTRLINHQSDVTLKLIQMLLS